MKKRITSMFLVLFVMLSLLSGNVLASPASGSGTEKNPYLIATAQDLKEFRDEVNKGTKKSTSTLCAKLTADIDLSSLEGNWEPIGKMTKTYSDYVAYGGTFDGNGFTISGLSIDSKAAYQGLFGYVKNGTIENLTVEGKISTSVTNSAYAAGIVAYGYPVQMNHCVNRVDVTATAGGVTAGVAAYVYGGSNIKNCTNQGTVKGSGNYVGGIAANVSGYSNSVTIEGCLNSGTVTNSGNSSYATGGIAGSVSGTASVVERCGNTGVISSTIKRTGGIVGSAIGTFRSCFNTGSVTGIYNTGGIAGSCAAKDTKITDCYNWGDVTCNTPKDSFKDDSYSKGVGGIVGDPSSNSYSGIVLTNCYNTGVIKNNSTTEGVVLGGVIGTSTGNNYSGVGTKGLITAVNCYYLKADGLQGDGADASAAGITAKSGEELKSAAMAEALGSSYIITQTGSYPMLGWQDPNAKYTVKFTLFPSTAKLTVKQGETVVDPEKDGGYLLKNGDYTYEVSAPECKTETGSFTVAYGGQTIKVTLTEQLYNVVFTTVPADADLTVEGRMPTEDGRTYLLPKSGNPYHYQLRAFGYEETKGSFTVTGNKKTDAQKITMTPLAKQTVTFGAVTAADEKEITPTITVTCPAWPKESLKAKEDGSYQLPAGDYQYVISCSGYKTVKGSFTVKDEAVQIPAVTLEVQTAWDGTTLVEPQKDADGVYQIGSPDELMWFDKNAKLNDSAVLTADIIINEDVKGDASGLYAWTPVGAGTSTTTRYTGSFDGQGHTISGLYVSASKYVGMFGYAEKGSKISNLTISNSVIKASGNNAGAIAGYADIIENCHVTESVEVTGVSYVGSVAGSVEKAISKSSNAGTVTATGNNVGGVVGRVQSDGSTAMTECYNVGSVSGASLVGGLTGNLYNGGTISDCYNTGSVTATAASGMSGGIVGNFRYGTIKNVYTNVKPTANTAGSVAGRLEWSGGQKTLAQVYVPTGDLETVGYLNSCKIQNGQAEAKTDDVLKALAPTLGEKFASDAKSINGGYPILAWQTGSAETDPDQPEIDLNGWDGTTAKVPDQAEGVCQISSAEELKWFADTAKKTPEIKGVLTADIDLNHQPWTPIAAFTGELDGQNHTIQNLYCKTNGAAGLFAQNAGTIRNLKIGGKIIGGDQTAAVASQNQGTIENCTSMAAVKGGNNTGGIAGENNGTIQNCTNTGTVRGNGKVAGIAGENKGTASSPAKVEGGVNTGLIWSENDMVGGIVGNNEAYVADFGQASVRNSANSGAIISQAAVKRSYTGGCVGRNNGSVDKLYNSGNVESRGGCTGGTLGLNLSKAIKGDMYNVGDVTGGDYEDDGYPTDNGVSSEEELAVARRDMKDVLARLSDRDAMDGSLILSGNPEVGAKIQAEYTGTRTRLIYVWYYSYDENDDAVLDITEDPAYTIPQDMGGRKLRVKVLSADTKGVLKAETDKVQGLTGVLKIQGAPVVGRTLTAVFQSSQGTDGLSYQWYQGKTAIKGATETTYTVTEADKDKILKVRVTSSKVAGQIEASTTKVTTAADADMWETSQCTEPENVGGVYVITNEKELHWFASEVNGGNTGISAKLADNIALTTDNWYPIGRTGHMFTGTFDGNEKKITNLKLTSTKSETGFFGLIGDGGKIQKLSLSGTVNASGDISQTGGVAGAMADRGDGKAANILDCSFAGTVNGEQQTGGIIGCVGLKNNVERCSNEATVTGTDQVGGIAGADSFGYIRFCKNTGVIGNESAKQVGGIVGELQNYAELTASYNTGSVTGKDYTGGIAGKVYVAAMPIGCYNVGTVSPAVYCGGAVGSFGGDDYITKTTGSFYQGPLSAAFKANGATERTEAQMKKDSFVAELNRDAYLSCYTKDSKNINNGYPVLNWEIGGFQVTFDPGKGHCNTASLIVEAGGSLKELPSAYRWNYRFDGWYTEEDGGDPVTGETKFQSDTTVYAHWTETRPSTGEQSKKTVYFSLSENGKYVTGKDQTLLAAVPVEVEWFDLAPYGLDQYTLKENGQVVKQPTVLHLMIRMLEKYYLGDGSTVKNNTEALKVTGNPCSLYLEKFWGHNENLIYYLNHQYPVMYEGTGATADYMTLENGDQIDLAMYSDMGFYTDPNAGFPYFAKPDGTVADSLEVTADKAETLVVHRGAADMMQGKPADKTIASAKVYSSTEIENDTAAWEDVAVTDETLLAGDAEEYVCRVLFREIADGGEQETSGVLPEGTVIRVKGTDYRYYDWALHVKALSDHVYELVGVADTGAALEALKTAHPEEDYSFVVLADLKSEESEPAELPPVPMEELTARGDEMDGALSGPQEKSYVSSDEIQAYAYGGSLTVPVKVTCSTDQGKHWYTTVVSGDDTAVRRLFLSFPDGQQGFLFATGWRTMWQEGSLLYHTEDGGASWTRVEPETWYGTDGAHSLMTGGAFVTDQVGFVTIRSSQWPELYRTVDGGRNWSLVELPIPDTEEASWYTMAYPPEQRDGKLYLYLGMEEYSELGGTKLRFESEDLGESWSYTGMVYRR